MCFDQTYPGPNLASVGLGDFLTCLTQAARCGAGRSPVRSGYPGVFTVGQRGGGTDPLLLPVGMKPHLGVGIWGTALRCSLQNTPAARRNHVNAKGSDSHIFSPLRINRAALLFAFLELDLPATSWGSEKGGRKLRD